MATISDAFISYSRRDSATMKRLYEALKARGLEAWVDWEDISKGDQWLDAIYDGIERANAFVLLISPDSMQSEICHKEIAYAIAHHKRFVPVMHREVDERLLRVHWVKTDWNDVARNNWHIIGTINWVFMRQTDDFEVAVEQLVNTIRTDLDYVKEHTHLGILAEEWDKNERQPEFLLRGLQLNAAETWLQNNRNQLPRPTELQNQFILASVAERKREDDERQAQQQRELELLQEANRRQKVAARRLRYIGMMLTVFFGLAMALSVFAFDQRTEAENQAATAVYAQNQAQIQATIAYTNLQDAQRTQSLLLADLSRQQRQQGAPQNAILLALESLRNYPDITTNEAQNALQNALANPVQEQHRLPFTNVQGALWNSDETKILAWAYNALDPAFEGSVRLWDMRNPDEPTTVTFNGAIYGARWMLNETALLTWSEDGTARILTADGLQTVRTFTHSFGVQGAFLNDDESRLVTWTADLQIYVWDIADASAPLFTFSHNGIINGVKWVMDETALLSWSDDNTARLYILGEEPLVTVFNHQSPVVSADLSPDGSHLLTVGSAMRWWDVANPALPLYLYNANADDVPILGATLDESASRILAWGGSVSFGTGVVQVWNVENSIEPILSYTLEDGLVRGALWGDNQREVVFWGSDNAIHVWDLRNPESPLALSHDSPIIAGLIDSNGNKVMAWEEDGFIKIWNLNSIQDVVVLAQGDGISLGSGSSAFGVEWSSNQESVLAWLNGQVHVWGLNSPIEPRLFNHDQNVNDFYWSADGTRLWTWTLGDTLTYWDLDNRGNDQTLVFLYQLQGAVFNQPETLLLSWSNLILTKTEILSYIEFYNATTLERFRSIELPDWETYQAAWSADENRFLARSRHATDGRWRIAVWDVARPDSPSAIYETTQTVRFAQWSPDSQHILLWLTDSSNTLTGIYVWALGETIVPLTYGTGEISGAEWNADGAQIVTWYTDGTVAIWNVADLTFPHLTFRYSAAVVNARWSADNRTILAWTNAGIVAWALSDVTTPLYAISIAEGRITGAIWNEAESLVLAWTFNNGVFVWDVANPSATRYRFANGLILDQALWSPDETRIVTLDFENNVRLWDLQQSPVTAKDLVRPITTTSSFQSLSGGERRAEWSADGQRLLYGSNSQNYLILWETDFDALIGIARNNIFRELTDEERIQFFLATSDNAP